MKNVLITILAVALLVGLSVWCYTCNQVKENVTDNAFSSYEEFQEIDNTCNKLNTDLCNMRNLSEKDAMFQQFSKAQRINTIKTQLNRWVEDYNAKSKMWNKSMWKSKALPYQLSVTDFNCYQDK